MVAAMAGSGEAVSLGSGTPAPTGPAAIARQDFRLLVTELREQNLDSVRFATYRAACKLRFIQKRVNLHLVDIWNVIEAFRENGLNAVEWGAEVKVSRVELLLSTVYHNLNKRLPSAQHIDTDASIRLLLAFLLGAYDKEDLGRLRVFSVKVALATLCAGKLLDKLRYMFSQISDSGGSMDHLRFQDYMREVLALPTAVFEGPTFGFSENSPKQAFDPKAVVTVNLFLDTLMADPCPACLMWLPLLHRMASVEHVFHPVVCDGCGKDSFTGFRYKCQRCHNYQLCQDCFWRGRVSGNHTNQHEMKEYSSYMFPEEPERPLDLANVVPGTRSLVGEPRGDFGPYYDSLDSGGLPHNLAHLLTPGPGGHTPLDDEHRLIARYAAKLPAPHGRRHPDMVPGYPDDPYAQRSAIARLQQRNREIMREIEELRALGGMSASLISEAPSGVSGELDSLRHRKAELENRMGALQDTRRELMGQLEGLMRVLRTQGGSGVLREGSPGGSPGLSAFADGSRPPFQRESRTPVSSLYGEPVLGQAVGSVGPSSVGTGVRSLPLHGGSATPRLPAIGPSGKAAGTLQGDLLSAADSITNTMSSLVKELHGPEGSAGQRRKEVRAGSQPLSLPANHSAGQLNGR